jgi:hypothetical protein
MLSRQQSRRILLEKLCIRHVEVLIGRPEYYDSVELFNGILGLLKNKALQLAVPLAGICSSRG